MDAVSGVILAGGASRRMGRDKALLVWRGRPLIETLAGRLRLVADEIIIVANHVEQYTAFADRCVPDVFTGVGALGGIHAGLQAAVHEWAFIVACDMPFLNPAVLASFLAATDGADLVVLNAEGYLEPLHALYHKNCLPAIETAIRSGQRCAFSFYDQVRVRYVIPSEIAHLDAGLRSFRNVNTPAEWQTVLLEEATIGEPL